MAYAIDDVVAEVCAGLNARWRGIDPLLPLLPGLLAIQPPAGARRRCRCLPGQAGP